MNAAAALERVVARYTHGGEVVVFTARCPGCGADAWWRQVRARVGWGTLLVGVDCQCGAVS